MVFLIPLPAWPSDVWLEGNWASDECKSREMNLNYPNTRPTDPREKKCTDLNGFSQIQVSSGKVAFLMQGMVYHRADYKLVSVSENRAEFVIDPPENEGLPLHIQRTSFGFCIDWSFKGVVDESNEVQKVTTVRCYVPDDA